MVKIPGPKAPLPIVLVGWCAIARRLAELLQHRAAPVQLRGVATRRAPTSDAGLPPDVPWLPGPEALGGVEADLVIEAAGREAVEPWGHVVLRSGRRFIITSTSALCEDGVLDRLTESALEGGGQILIPSGALAAVDALAAASVLPLDCVTHRIVKPPRAWIGTPAETMVDLSDLAEAHTFFEGSAREAASRFPANANVAAISALAGIGLDRTRVELVADPQATRNGHRLEATGAFGKLVAQVENRPLATNPKSSELTALALVRLVENQCGPIAL